MSWFFESVFLSSGMVVVLGERWGWRRLDGDLDRIIGGPMDEAGRISPLDESSQARLDVRRAGLREREDGES